MTSVKTACLTHAVGSCRFKSFDVKPRTVYRFHEASVMQPFSMPVQKCTYFARNLKLQLKDDALFISELSKVHRRLLWENFLSCFHQNKKKVVNHLARA